MFNIKPYLYSNFTAEATAASEQGDDEEQHLYDLAGIVIHQGSASRGHYYAYIKDRSTAGRREQWYEFNDKNVQRREYGHIAREAFGGSAHVRVDERDSPQSGGKRGSSSSSNPWNKHSMGRPSYKQESVEILSERNAYVLFYEQRAVKNAQRRSRMRGSHEEQARPWAHVDYLAEQHRAIADENTKLFRQQTLYDPDFVAFMRRLYSVLLVSGADKRVADDHRVLMSFVFSVVPIEVRDKAEIKWWWSRLRLDEAESARLLASPLLPAYIWSTSLASTATPTTARRRWPSSSRSSRLWRRAHRAPIRWTSCCAR